MGLDIPMLLAGYNDMKFSSAMTVKMQMDGTDKEKWPDKCIGCGACSSVCPQHIDIPKVLKEFDGMLKTGPTWEEMCKIKGIFFGPDECCVEYHPAEKDYVNVHPYCLHIWRPQNAEIPKPPTIFV